MNPVRRRKKGSKNKANAEVRELARTYTTVAIKTLAALMLSHFPPGRAPRPRAVVAARTVAEIGMHQYDAGTILRLDKIEAAQRRP
jgi:hypothetical protein